MTTIQAIVLAVVEGITEFLPISSTGHMIIASSLMGIASDDFTKLFEVAIQLGAIVSVIVLYWRRFFPLNKWNFYFKLIVAVIPALILGFLFKDKIDELLEKPTPVAISFLVGGIVLLFIDNIFRRNTIDREKEISYGKGFIIGIWQCLSLMPGVSRSAASIIGGMQQKLTRRLAAEFSFFLAVPTMTAATAAKFWDTYQLNPAIITDTNNIKLLLIGAFIAFIVAMLAIKFFISYLQRYGFKLFGVYRILAGIVLLILIWRGILV
ncbi:MAG TPA: undecaprenyl-diphosphate phosphatase [Parafilimonas sp.]|nr:undecaprenyl-diphosphate phosphatase [Parafilimonas sp.]